MKKSFIITFLLFVGVVAIMADEEENDPEFVDVELTYKPVKTGLGDRYAIHTHGWDYGSNHLFQVNNGSPYLDYNDVKTQKILRDKLKLLSVDYFFFLYF